MAPVLNFCINFYVSSRLCTHPTLLTFNSIWLCFNAHKTTYKLVTYYEMKSIPLVKVAYAIPGKFHFCLKQRVSKGLERINIGSHVCFRVHAHFVRQNALIPV